MQTHLIARLLSLSLVFVTAGAASRITSTAERVSPRAPLTELPSRLADWQSRGAATFDERTLQILGADDYISRLYERRPGDLVDVYVGYYASQREGDLIHSPLNCLPGAGWQPIERGRVPLEIGASTPAVAVNRVIIQKGEDRQAVLYWYQGRGRIVASEYVNRAYLALDAVRRRRTDGALVRLITPIGSESDAIGAAMTRLTSFGHALSPALRPFIPD